MAATVPNIKLNSGFNMPIFGLGTFNGLDDVRTSVKQAVKDAIDAGYRLFDGAHIYRNQKEVGEAIREKIDDGTVTREELFITSKLWITSFNEGAAVPACRKTLEDLGLSYIDLYLVHWPTGFKAAPPDAWDWAVLKDDSGRPIPSEGDYKSAWKGVEECAKLGLTKSIGFSNFNSVQVQTILDMCTIQPAMNQIESHGYLPNTKLIDFCKGKGISVTVYSSLGAPGTFFGDPGKPVLLADPQLKPMVAKYNKTAAQVLLRFQVQRGVVCIPKSVTKARIEENFKIFDFELSAEDMKLLSDGLGPTARCFPFIEFDQHRDYPFHIEF